MFDFGWRRLFVVDSLPGACAWAIGPICPIGPIRPLVPSLQLTNDQLSIEAPSFSFFSVLSALLFKILWSRLSRPVFYSPDNHSPDFSPVPFLRCALGPCVEFLHPPEIFHKLPLDKP